MLSSRSVTKEYESSWIFEPCLTCANALRRVQNPGFSLVSALPALDPQPPPILITRRTTKPTKSLLNAGMVGAGGVEPPSSSVSANNGEPLCARPFLQVALDRRGRS